MRYTKYFGVALSGPFGPSCPQGAKRDVRPPEVPMNATFRYAATISAAANPLSLRGLVSTPHYLASQAGLDILRRGGTAVDAAIAAAAVLSVVYPHMCGLGGDNFWLIYDAAHGQLKALNGSGRAALSATPEFYAMRSFKAVPARGYMAVNTVPGAVSGWGEAYALSRSSLGSPLSWAELLDAARGYAQDGFVVNASLAHWLAAVTSNDGPGRALHQFTAFRELFCKEEGRVYAFGDVLRQENLARTLARLAENGPDEFYHGEIARAIADAMMLHSGMLTVGDLAEHHADWAEPLSVPYREYIACAPPPNCQGLTTLEILNILNQTDVAALGEGSADYYHLLAEAAAAAMRDRDRYLTDPAFADIPVQRLLSPAYGREQAARINLARSAGPLAPLTPGGDTVWLGVTDAAGNAVSLIQSIYHEFGSGMVAGGTGILLQNRGCAFSLDPAAINCLEPGKRPPHTLSPAMLLKDGKPRLVYGSMGGSGQPQTLAALATRIVDFGFSPQDAVNAPRCLLGRSWGAPDNDLKLEGRIPESVAEELRKRGHAARRVEDYTEIMGHAGAILRHDNGAMQGATDLRGDGLAAAY